MHFESVQKENDEALNSRPARHEGSDVEDTSDCAELLGRRVDMREDVSTR